MAVKRKMMDVNSDGTLTDPSKLEQGSAAWHAWRGRGLGASDAPALMGMSPWKTPFELWAEKAGILPPEEATGHQAAAMARGTRLEPRARELYIEQTGIVVEPQTFTHPEHEFLRASLDGWNEEKKHIVEIKVPNKADIATAKAGRIPKKYFSQLTHQLLVKPDAATLDYVTLEEGRTPDDDKIYVVSFVRDRDEEQKLLTAALNFWEHVQTQTPYQFEPKDLDKVAQRLVKEMDRAIKSVQAIAILSKVMSEDAADV
jgi:putative phage-type endonuclease